MNARTKLLIAGSATALVLTGSSFTHAATSSTSSSSDSLVSRIATRFNVNKADVQGVFDQDKAARLDKAVSDGTITSAQKDLITAKQIEIRTKMGALKSEDTTARKADMKKLMDDTRAWATANKIDPKWLGSRMMGGHRGMHRNFVTPTPTIVPSAN